MVDLLDKIAFLLIKHKEMFLLLFIIISVQSKYIVIPLKKYTYDYNDNDNMMTKIYSNILYTELSIGEPKQTIITLINTTTASNIGIYNKYCDSNFYLNNANINKEYSYINSSTFYQIGEGDMKIGTKDILIKDQITFFTNFELTEKIEVKNISILYNPNNEEYILDDVGMDFIIEKEKRTTCGYIGFKLGYNYEDTNNNLLNQLKEKNIISNTIFSFIEVNKNNDKYKKNNIEYLLIIGDEIYDVFNKEGIDKYISTEYNRSKYIEECKLNDYIISDGYYFIWKLTFSNIYLNISNNVTNMVQIQNIFLDYNYGLIVGTKEYRTLILENFFNQYISNDTCFEKTLRTYDIGSFYYYVCNNTININNFPSLYLKSKVFQYEFRLTKDDLFITYNNKIYFLIIFEFSRTNTWKLGIPFLNKYLYSFNYDSKIISFYNENLIIEKKEKNEKKEPNNNNYTLIIIIISIILLVALAIGFLISRIIYYQRKRQKALELENNLDYDYKEEEDLNKDEKNIILSINK